MSGDSEDKSPKYISDLKVSKDTATVIAIVEIDRRVATLEAQAKIPIHKNKIFWLGMAWVPVVFITGWVLKAADFPVALREIHRLLGTEPALVAALDEKSSSLKSAIENLSENRVPLLTSLFKVGLQQERVESVTCQPDVNNPTKIKYACTVPDSAFVKVADAALPVGQKTHVDIGIVVNVTDNIFKDGVKYQSIDVTTDIKIADLIKISVNGEDLPLKPSKFSPKMDMQGGENSFSRYKFPCLSFDPPEVPDFPINTLSVSVGNQVSRFYSITGAVMVTENRHDCAKKT